MISRADHEPTDRHAQTACSYGEVALSATSHVRSSGITLRESYLGGSDASAEWNAVWTVAMVYADLAALTGPARLAERAAADLSLRLGQL
jgi:hypothetical protein